MKKFLYHSLVIISLLLSKITISQIPYLVKDINGARDAYPQNSRSAKNFEDNQPFAVLNGRAYFGITINGGWQLWRSNGTEAGTQLVKIISVAGSKVPIYDITTCGNQLFFIADDGVNGVGLWKSDGTAAGTVLLKANHATTSVDANTSLTAVGNMLFYISNDNLNGPQLWMSDGTAAGTKMVINIANGNNLGVTNLCVIDSKVYFSFYSPDIANGGLWVSNSTGTQVNKIQGYINQANNQLTAVGKKLFFVNMGELWATDGTENNAYQVKDIWPGVTTSSPDHFTAFKNLLCFVADDGSNGRELWRSDGTQAGTYLLKDINTVSKHSSSPLYLTAIGNTLFFLAKTASGNYELYKTDGTNNGTEIIKSFGNEVLAPGNNLANINGTLLFAGYTTEKGLELWRSDGSVAGTYRVKDIFNGVYSSSPYGITNLGSQALFCATDQNGAELWATDGTEAGTSMVKNINSGGFTSSSEIRSFTKVKDKVFFGASNSKYGFELWAIDSANATASLVKDIQPGGISGLTQLATPFVTTDSDVYFLGQALQSGLEIWKSDGTAAGTALVKDITAGPAGSFIPFSRPYYTFNTFAGLKNTLYFVADSVRYDDNGNSSIGSRTLWKTNGTPGTTKLVKNFPLPRVYDLDLRDLTPAGDKMFFTWQNEIYVTDSTPVDTHDVGYQAITAYPEHNMIYFKGFLFFVYNDNELWKADGTRNGASLVKDIFPGPFGSTPRHFVISGDQLFFTADNGTNGTELWVTNATEKGTRQVKDLVPGVNSSSPANLVDVEGLLYFFTFENATSVKLWVTNGTSAGTRVVKKIAPGNTVSISSAIKVGNKICFIVTNGTTGTVKIWQSDGSAAGTNELNTNGQVIPADTYSNSLAAIGNTVYFPAYFPVVGTELWAINLSGVLPVTFSNFSVELNNSDGLLKWQTVTEQNADYFTIKRSLNGNDFMSIDSVKATGNSNMLREYNYTDYGITKLGVDKVFYRIEEVDNDNKRNLSKTLLLKIYNEVSLLVYPNPISNSLKIKLSSLQRQQLGIVVTDARGVVMVQQQKQVTEGENTIVYNTANWANGSYMVSITANGVSIKNTIVVKQ